MSDLVFNACSVIILISSGIVAWATYKIYQFEDRPASTNIPLEFFVAGGRVGTENGIVTFVPGATASDDIATYLYEVKAENEILHDEYKKLLDVATEFIAACHAEDDASVNVAFSKLKEQVGEEDGQ